MQLNTLKARHGRLRTRTIGRGGKRGKTSGRGTKGQRARAGHKIRPALRDIIKKLPKLRGYRFQSIGEKPLALSLTAVAAVFEDGATVTAKALHARGLIRERTAPVKILGSVAISKKLLLKNVLVSKSARTHIEHAGGSVSYHG